MSHQGTLKSWRGWVSPISALLLALALRMVWIHDLGCSADVGFFVNWTRLASTGGISHMLQAADSSYPPVSAFLLWIISLFAKPQPLGAPPTIQELLALRVSIICADLLTVAVLCNLERRITRQRRTALSAWLYAVCPSAAYLSGWWPQTEAWFVLPTLLGAWWLSQAKPERAWAMLGVAVAIKPQAIIVLPVFAVGTWRWWGATKLLSGTAVLLAALLLVTVPFLVGDQAADLFAKMIRPGYDFPWISLESHNLWYALTPAAREFGQYFNRDANAVVAGLSFHDFGLALLAIGFGVVLARLFIRSGPSATPAACAIAWLMFFMLPTRIHARYSFPALALMLHACMYDRRWTILYGVATITSFINLWSRAQEISASSGLPFMMPAEIGLVSSWANVAVLLSATVLFVQSALRPARPQAELEGKVHRIRTRGEWVLLAAGTLFALTLVGAVLWHGHTIGGRVSALEPSLRTSLNTALENGGAASTAVIVNWPAAILGEQDSDLFGIVPVTPPGLFMGVPSTAGVEASWVQYIPWQEGTGLEIEYYGNEVTLPELRAMARSAEQVVVFSPRRRQMLLFSAAHQGSASPECRASFDETVCLVDAQLEQSPSGLQVELVWQVTGTPETGDTVFVHVVDTAGSVVAQADGDPARGLIRLSSLEREVLLHEVRYVTLLPGDHLVRVGLYNRISGERLEATCTVGNVCRGNALEVTPDS